MIIWRAKQPATLNQPMEPAVTNRIIHSHPAPGCTGPTYWSVYSVDEWSIALTADMRTRVDGGLPVKSGERIYVNPIAFYNRLREVEGATA